MRGYEQSPDCGAQGADSKREASPKARRFVVGENAGQRRQVASRVPHRAGKFDDGRLAFGDAAEIAHQRSRWPKAQIPNARTGPPQSGDCSYTDSPTLTAFRPP